MTIQLLTGDDESMLRSAVADRVGELVGAGDRSMMVDEFAGEEYELRAVVDAAQTPPFLTDRRVVVAWGVGRFVADELAPLLGYLADPLESTDLVLVGGGGRLPKKLTDAVKAVGTVTSTAAPSRPRDRQHWVRERIAASGLVVEGPAAGRVADWLGEDVGRLDGIIATLRSTYGTSSTLRLADVEPFLGEAGGVPPWDFTDAIDAGNTTTALQLAARMLHAGGRHPLQVMSILHGHYAGLARLDGVDARDEHDVMAATGIKSAFPAKKALQNSRRLGTAGVRRAMELLAAADLDLRGATELDQEVVLEVLVARLSRLGR